MTGVSCRDGVVRLDGVPGFGPGQYASSPHGCQATVLAWMGEPLTYEDLVCFSGFAFRVGVHTEMCPSAGHPCCGYMCVERSNRLMPWRAKQFASFPWDEPKPDRAAFEAEACAAIKASIDRGMPVQYCGEEDGLIVGYADEGRRWLCLHPYHKQGKEEFWHDEVKGLAGGSWPWVIVVWRGRRLPEEELRPDDALRGALTQAVAMWSSDRRGDYYCGLAAYDHWLQWLRGVEAGDVADPRAGMQGNGWCYDVLLGSRRMAGAWLAAQAARFEETVAEGLLEAASGYQAMSAALGEGLTCPWDLALPPGRYADWGSDLRQEQIRRLIDAKERDAQAIEGIGKALRAW